MSPGRILPAAHPDKGSPAGSPMPMRLMQTSPIIADVRARSGPFLAFTVFLLRWVSRQAQEHASSRGFEAHAGSDAWSSVEQGHAGTRLKQPSCGHISEGRLL